MEMLLDESQCLPFLFHNLVMAEFSDGITVHPAHQQSGGLAPQCVAPRANPT